MSETPLSKLIKSSKDVFSVLTVLVGFVFGYVVLQTTVSAHTAKLVEVSSQINDISLRFENKLEKQQERTSDIEVKLARIDGKLDMILEKQGQKK